MQDAHGGRTIVKRMGINSTSVPVVKAVTQISSASCSSPQKRSVRFQHNKIVKG